MTKFIAALILLNLSFAQAKVTPLTESEVISINQEYLELVNEYRIDQKLAPLTSNPIIEKIAYEHSRGMALKTREFSHLGFSQRCTKIKSRLAPHKKCGEIIAYGQKNAKAVLKAWLNSPPHKAAIEGVGYNHTGLGIYRNSRGVIYWTQMFIKL